MRKFFILAFVCLFLLFWAGCHQEDRPSAPNIDNVPSESPSHEHSWDDGTVTKNADCKEMGVVIYTCPCGIIKTETISTTANHLWDNGEEQNGKKVYTCQICSSQKTEDLPVEPKPETPAAPETPTNPETPAPLPHTHNWDGGTVTKIATCREEGRLTFLCVCGEIKTQSIPLVSQHIWDQGKTDGNTQLFTCTLCGEVKTITIEPPPSTDIPNVNEGDAVTSSPAPYPVLLKPTATGVAETRNNLAVIDYSNSADGYIMAQYTDATNKRIKVQVKHGSNTYTYNITPQNWAVLPLSEGDGQYKITIYRQVEDTKYSTIISETIDVRLKNDFSTFLYPNQYVDYSLAPKSVDKAYELTKFITDPLQKVAVIYDFVVDHLTYDKQKAATVQSGYLPILDEVLESGKGICFDYAALMTGMLRSQGIPCKLVVGYAGKAYHAWINVWTKESGWIDGVIFFDGANWQRMDPTFASSSNRSDSIMEYIGDGTNYIEKYLY